MTDADGLLEALDEDQQAAVRHGEGPLLVVAGAGSGKTRVLTYRIAYLLATGQARAHEILAVTFTNKAAREMVERVEALLGGPLAGGFVGTFHRFGLQFLRVHAREAGLPARFAVADDDEQRQLVERAMKRLEVPATRMKSSQVRARISRAKNALVVPEAAAAAARSADDHLVADLYAAYDEALRAAGAVDYDDMILLPCSVLEREDGLRRSLAARFRWILVDEFQDTNASQARLLRLLAPSRPNLTAVGDEDQSIYRWRGAEIENILSFEESYPGARVVVLGRNYRSREPILAAAAAVIARNERRRAKHLTSEAGPGAPVALYLASDEEDEARFVVDQIAQLEGRVPLGRIAVLFRLNSQSRSFETMLVRRAVAYSVVRGTRFWERAEVRDALAYLRLLVAPEDELAFRRAVHVPARGIGQATMERLEAAAGATGATLASAARQAGDDLTPRARQALERFFTLIDELTAMTAYLPPGELVSALLERSGLAAQYAGDDEDDRARRGNLDQLVNSAAEAGERGQGLGEFLDEVALLTEADGVSSSEAVQLSTLHAAKGLEWDVVFLVGLEDGLLPLRRGDDDDDVEEERRLAYVGMTRARTQLFLTAARSRRLHGQLLPGRPSAFLLDVPPTLLEDRSGMSGRDAFRAHGAPIGGRADARRAWGAPVRPAPTTPTGSAHAAPLPRHRGPVHPDGWRPGLKVNHPSFGRGVILQVQGVGAQTRVVVFFDRAGRKTLLPALAKLDKV